MVLKRGEKTKHEANICRFLVCPIEYSKTTHAINTEWEHCERADRVLSVWEEAHVSAVVEENSHGVIRQLVAEAVLVGVVHPFSHPLKTAAV